MGGPESVVDVVVAQRGQLLAEVLVVALRWRKGAREGRERTPTRIGSLFHAQGAHET